MRNVNIRKDEFIDKVAANRATHRAAFERSVEGYQRLLLRELERRISDVKAGRPIEHYIRLPEPSDHTEDYDRVLAMAQMSVDEVIHLDADDFGRFAMDQWPWKNDFVETTAYYDCVVDRNHRQGARG